VRGEHALHAQPAHGPGARAVAQLGGLVAAQVDGRGSRSGKHVVDHRRHERPRRALGHREHRRAAVGRAVLRERLHRRVRQQLLLVGERLDDGDELDRAPPRLGREPAERHRVERPRALRVGRHARPGERVLEVELQRVELECSAQVERCQEVGIARHAPAAQVERQATQRERRPVHDAARRHAAAAREPQLAEGLRAVEPRRRGLPADHDAIARARELVALRRHGARGERGGAPRAELDACDRRPAGAFRPARRQVAQETAGIRVRTWRVARHRAVVRERPGCERERDRTRCRDQRWRGERGGRRGEQCRDARHGGRAREATSAEPSARANAESRHARGFRRAGQPAGGNPGHGWRSLNGTG